MNRRTLGIVGALALAGAACGGSGSSGDSLLGGSGSASGGSSSNAVAPGNFSNPNNPGPGGTTPVASGSTGSGSSSSTGSGSTGTGATGTADAGNPSIDDRVVNYGEALRTASVKLISVLPDLADIQAIAAATDPATAKTLYESKIDAMLADTRFADTQITWWRNTLKTGQPTDAPELAAIPKGSPNYDTAALFAASVVVSGAPYSTLFTAATGTCPTYANGTFTPADCTNGGTTAGVLSDPGLMSQYFSHMAFRRVRFVQETFACSAFPAELSATPTAMGSGEYTSPWPFDSITGGATAKINFQDTSAVICANCHTSINHLAPLFANFDTNGKYSTTVQVQTPVTPPVTTVLADWLPAGQALSWRVTGTPITDLQGLGKSMGADPDVARCAVTRVWDWAFSRGDVVNDGAPVPTSVSDSYLAAFQASNLNVKTLIRSVFTSDDFVKF